MLKQIKGELRSNWKMLIFIWKTEVARTKRWLLKVLAQTFFIAIALFVFMIVF